ncbi:L-rhamnose mutarotase [Mucilaginibacter sp. OK283]|jgi:L-rhamnose mutarotase|uniref:L-rhamnose mutarotase n=1 Tax=Mucilaginibacter sp. OK283 TaxID=1881049 RepID=UPI0008C55FE5|nr:L-rhamnose mutarotase [Mucilaginibacter sp. OK283]SEP41744.1 L-rhamnose mutarotase [Mucilaginibacter sp. OK283]
MNKVLLQIQRFAIILISCIIGFSACKSGNKKATLQQDTASAKAVQHKSVQRFGMVTGLKPEKMAYYKQLHSHAWPGVLKKITECNIRNYSIYIQKIDGKYFLFSYFEYVGVDFKGDMAKMAADTTTRRWWKETDPTQIPLPEAAAHKQQWQAMDEVFHMN